MDPLTEIDWNKNEKIYRDGIPTLLRHIEPASILELTFWSDSNGGFNFDAYQANGNGELIRLGDRADDWGVMWDDLGLDELFEDVADRLAENDDFDSLDAKIRVTLRRAVEALAAQGFGFDASHVVRWKIRDEVE